ncbi:hypothetical protein SAMN05444722_2971 [Rhodovulum sp. ES.010]|uniref:YaiI/YqxD family protein n=1 Tax=Rhodovulum sp. ES.010 TaxID=1882821 RepID=UPI00092AE056|nr:YaiI/YqxD family protein [Rhodovulum sp. ES.010]SIO51722.1 hypothetical protein SAMN05444722_2971 [Rhodovulum sp. ES.010]
MSRIFVDADACPVKAEALRVAERHGAEIHYVANGGLRPVDHPLARMVYVPDGPDEADKWIAERAGPGDVVVTADVPLAAKCVGQGARVLNHNGEPFTEANIGQKLASRDLMADLRAADPFRQGGGRAFSKADRSRFLDGLERVLRAAGRGG